MVMRHILVFSAHTGEKVMARYLDAEMAEVFTSEELKRLNKGEVVTRHENSKRELRYVDADLTALKEVRK